MERSAGLVVQNLRISNADVTGIAAYQASDAVLVRCRIVAEATGYRKAFRPSDSVPKRGLSATRSLSSAIGGFASLMPLV